MLGLIYSLFAALFLATFALGVVAPTLPFLFESDLLLSISLIPIGIYVSTMTLIYGIPFAIKFYNTLQECQDELVRSSITALLLSGTMILFGLGLPTMFFFVLGVFSFVLSRL